MKAIHLAHVAGLCLAASAANAQTPVLSVLTYDSFASEWGPGPEIERAFEAICGCDVQFTTAGDGAALLARLQLEGPATDTDVVIGLDTALTARARATGLFAPLAQVGSYDLPVAWTDTEFVPFDWGYFAFVGQEDTAAPRSFEELAASDITVVIEDPRSSTPGLGLLMWVRAAYGDRAPEIWAALADNIVTVTPGWSEAYGLFLNGEADAVLSYTTSPAYHIIAEGDATKRAWMFDEGHYMQIEVAGQLASSDQPELAAAFLQFLTGEVAQAIIPTTNWMYPARLGPEGLPEGFMDPASVARPLLLSEAEAEAIYAQALDEWRAALSQ